MTLVQIEKRVKALEQTMHQFVQARPPSVRKWYRAYAGRFANDREFEEIVRLGREYRLSQRPASRRKRP